MMRRVPAPRPRQPEQTPEEITTPYADVTETRKVGPLFRGAGRCKHRETRSVLTGYSSSLTGHMVGAGPRRWRGVGADSGALHELDHRAKPTLARRAAGFSAWARACKASAYPIRHRIPHRVVSHTRGLRLPSFGMLRFPVRKVTDRRRAASPARGATDEAAMPQCAMRTAAHDRRCV